MNEQLLSVESIEYRHRRAWIQVNLRRDEYDWLLNHAKTAAAEDAEWRVAMRDLWHCGHDHYCVGRVREGYGCQLSTGCSYVVPYPNFLLPFEQEQPEMVDCDWCDGKGCWFDSVGTRYKCAECGGTGKVPKEG